MADDTKAPDDQAAPEAPTQQSETDPQAASPAVSPEVEKPSAKEGAGAEPASPASASVDETAEPAPARVSIPHLPDPVGAPWGLPLKKFLDRWTRVETYLCVAVIIAEIFALVAWVILKGLGTPTSAGTPTGTIVRAALGALVLGIVTFFATRKQNLTVQRVATTSAIVVGLAAAGLWANIGVVYFSNILNWLQDASSLTLIGGLRGLGTRLTIWLAMLGGSLAAASGKHIHIDVVMRFVPRKARVSATLVTWAGAALVCFSAAWGFVDHIAIESYDVERDASAGAKFSAIGHHASQGLFVLRKQIGLDLSTLPTVIGGNPYDDWLTNGEWNRRVKDAGWEGHFSPEQVAALQMPPETAAEKRLPVVMVPGATHQGLLKHLLNLVFPFGFLIIGLRFLLRGVLAISGHVSVDPDAVHAAPTVSSGDDTPDVPAKGGAA